MHFPDLHQNLHILMTMCSLARIGIMRILI